MTKKYTKKLLRVFDPLTMLQPYLDHFSVECLLLAEIKKGLFSKKYAIVLKGRKAHIDRIAEYLGLSEVSRQLPGIPDFMRKI